MGSRWSPGFASEPDWLLIFLIVGDEITFVRTGTHSDLFGE